MVDVSTTMNESTSSLCRHRLTEHHMLERGSMERLWKHSRFLVAGCIFLIFALPISSTSELYNLVLQPHDASLQIKELFPLAIRRAIGSHNRTGDIPFHL
jgi:hypothetical protein